MTWRPASHRRFAGVRWRGGRAAGMLALLAAVVLALLGLVGEPARADEPSLPAAPEGCEAHVEDYEDGNRINVFVNGQPWLHCDHDPGDENCVMLVSDNWLTGPIDGSRPTICPVDPQASFEECRNDVRFSLAGPFTGGSWNNPFPGDPETAWSSVDLHGHVLIPNDSPDDFPEWWLNEFHAENILANDGDHEGGQGCEVGASYPEHLSCEEVNQRIDELRPDAELYDRWEAGDGQSRDDIGNRQDVGALRRASAELRDLETVGGLIPDDCWGTYPLDRYQITWDPGDDDELQSSNRLMGFLASVLFGVAKTLVGIMLWLIRLAFTFNVNDYRAAVGDFAQRIDQNLVHLGSDHPLTLFDVAWFALFAYAGFQALRGRAGRAVGELAMAVLMAGLGVVLIGNFFPAGGGDSFRSTVSPDQPAYGEGGYFDSAGDLLNLSALGLLNVANGDDPNVSDDVLDDPQAVRELIRETNERLHHEFIQRPYWFINYNREHFDEGDGESAEPVEGMEATGLLPAADDDRDFSDDYEPPSGWSYTVLSCDVVADHLQSLPDTEGGWTGRFMERNGCRDMAEWNGEMTVERLMMTVLVTAVAAVVAVGVGLAAITLLLAKFLVAVLFVALPLAVVLAILPGQSRSLAWGWLTSLLQLWLVALGMGVVLVTVLLGVDAIHATTAGRSLAERWLMILLLVATVYLLRKRMTSGAQGLASSLQERLSASTGEQAWAGGGGKRQRLNEIDLAGVDRGAVRTGMTTRVMALAGTAMATRAGLRTAGAVNHGVLGGIRRSIVAEYGRRRSAALGQAWHLRSSKFMHDYKTAQETLSGAKPAREDALADSDVGRRRQAMRSRRQNRAEKDALVATKDYEDLSHRLHFNLREKKRVHERKAAQRFGIDPDAWNAGSVPERKTMLAQAQKQMIDMQKAAGFNDPKTFRTQRYRHAEAVGEQRNANFQRGAQFTHSEHLDRRQRGTQRVEEQYQQALAQRDRQLKQAGYQSWDEAQLIANAFEE